VQAWLIRWPPQGSQVEPRDLRRRCTGVEHQLTVDEPDVAKQDVRAQMLGLDRRGAAPHSNGVAASVERVPAPKDQLTMRLVQTGPSNANSGAGSTAMLPR